MTFSVTAKVK